MLSIRLGTEADLPFLSELMKMSGVEIPGVDYTKWSHLVIVAEDNGNVVGFVQFLLGHPYCHLTEMSVHPDYRSKGLGRMIVEAADEALRSQGYGAWVTFTAKEDLKDSLVKWGMQVMGQGYGLVRDLRTNDGNC